MRRITRTLLIVAALSALAGCQDALDSVANKVEHPLPPNLREKMEAQDMAVRSPIMIRIFKEEDLLEVWKEKGNGRFGKVAEYEICAWSGELGPKKKEGDRQAPEGFYTVRPHQMNPKSSYYLSFNIGYPNAFDRAHRRTGTNLMVHGACSSAGCYSMTDESVLEIYAFAREAFRGGQEGFQVQAFPFRMTAENMARHRDHESYEFWQMLKVGYDHFELTKRPPQVEVCDYRYVFNQQLSEDGSAFVPTAGCPAMSTPEPLLSAYQRYKTEYQAAFEVAVLDLEEQKRRQAEAERRQAEAERQRVIAEAQAADRARAAEEALAPIASAAGGALSSLSSFLSLGDRRSNETPRPAAVPQAGTAAPAATDGETAQIAQVPVPVPDPRDRTAVAADPRRDSRVPFWKIWGQ